MGTGIAITASKYLGNFYNEENSEENTKETPVEEPSSVVLMDVSENQLNKSRKFFNDWLLKEAKKNKISDANASKMNDFIKFKIFNCSLLCKSQPNENHDTLKKVDLCIEAVPENFDIKKNVFSHIDHCLPKSSIIASNTSTISITRLAAQTTRPDRFVGMHFTNPVPVMPLIEAIRGLRTSVHTMEIVKKFARKIGKTVACSKDTPGFVSNRVLMPYINEAVFALHEGVSTREEIDEIFKLGTNVPMGPLALADFIGLDTCLCVMNLLYSEFADSKYRPCPLLKQYVDAGFLGKKTQKGFYEY